MVPTDSDKTTSPDTTDNKTDTIVYDELQRKIWLSIARRWEKTVLKTIGIDVE